MFIKEIVGNYLTKGHNLRNAQNLAAEEILLSRIASSPLSEHVTLKGGIVMYNVANNERRVTQDIDFDLIRYSIDEQSIKLFINKLNSNEDFIISINGPLESLHQEDYRGVRVNLIIKDKKKDSLKIKLDIGVHTYLAIEQERLVFMFENNNNSISLKANPCEQVFAEKLLSLGRLGVLSTRYKDVYDIYYLINSGKLNINKIKNILSLFFRESKRRPNNLADLQFVIESTLNDNRFSKEANRPASKWIDVNYDAIVKTVIDYINSF